MNESRGALYEKLWHAVVAIGPPGCSAESHDAHRSRAAMAGACHVDDAVVVPSPAQSVSQVSVLSKTCRPALCTGTVPSVESVHGRPQLNQTRFQASQCVV